MPNKLLDYRKSIDLIDQAIVSLLAERIRIVKKVGQYKKRKSLPPLDKKRWSQVLKDKKNKAKSMSLNPKLIADIYNLIHDYALSLEAKVK